MLVSLFILFDGLIVVWWLVIAGCVGVSLLVCVGLLSLLYRCCLALVVCVV